MDSLATWLEATKLSWFVNNTAWVWATCETLHFLGMALLIGCVGILDLRMLGVGKRVPVGPLHRFITKMALILIAGANVLVFYTTVYRAAESLGPGDDAPLKAKIAAAVSITAWIGVIYFGRMLPFIGDAF
jgi:hypothetical protein